LCRCPEWYRMSRKNPHCHARPAGGTHSSAKPQRLARDDK
jgi:hypothetical protein